MNGKQLAYLAAIIVGIGLALILALRAMGGDGGDDECPTVVVIQLLEHPAVLDITSGLRSELGSADALNCAPDIREFNANGDPSALPTILAEAHRMSPSLIVPIFTPVAQAAVRDSRGVPIVFAAVTDPVGARVVADLEAPHQEAVTGVSDRWPVEQQLDLMLSLVPDTDTIGMPYNPGEQNSEVTVSEMRELCEARGIHLEVAPVVSETELLTAMASLSGDIDIIYTANDSTVAAGLPAFLRFARDRNVPPFAGDVDAVAAGAIATFGQSYRRIGERAGLLAALVLSGGDARNLDIVVADDADLYLNPAAAELFGIQIPDDLAAGAHNVNADFGNEWPH